MHLVTGELFYHHPTRNAAPSYISRYSYRTMKILPLAYIIIKACSRTNPQGLTRHLNPYPQIVCRQERPPCPLLPSATP